MLSRAEIMAAIDRYGSDLNAWPASAPAALVRAAVLKDRDLRAYLDGAKALDRALDDARIRRDAEIASSGGADRVRAAVLGQASLPGRRWRIAIAAALVIAAGIGSAVDFGLVERQTRGIEVVVVDPLVFGPTEIDGP